MNYFQLNAVTALWALNFGFHHDYSATFSSTSGNAVTQGDWPRQEVRFAGFRSQVLLFREPEHWQTIVKWECLEGETCGIGFLCASHYAGDTAQLLVLCGWCCRQLSTPAQDVKGQEVLHALPRGELRSPGWSTQQLAQSLPKPLWWMGWLLWGNAALSQPHSYSILLGEICVVWLTLLSQYLKTVPTACLSALTRPLPLSAWPPLRGVHV